MLFSDLRIRTKDRKLVAFEPNEVQVQYLDQLVPRWREGIYDMEGLQEIILKARQFGFSTLIAALFFCDTLNNPQTGTVVISNDQKNTKKLFEMVDRFYRHLPDEKRPRTQRANTDELYWPDIDCHYEVMTAGTKTGGRGWTVNNLHCSEVGFWKDEETIGGLLDAVPAGGNVFLESTANGEGAEQDLPDGETEISGSAFHVYYTRGKSGDSPFKSNFFPWYAHSPYRKTAPSDFTRLTEEDEKKKPRLFIRFGDETRYAEMYGLDDDQLYWRRQMISKPGKSPASFRQEYPANDVEAFRTSGNRFFAGVWDPDIHVRTVEIKPWWTPALGFDWGFTSPYAAGLGWFFQLPNGKIGCYISDEIYAARVRNTAQAQALKDLLVLRGIPPDHATVFADPAMWGKEGSYQSDNVGRANVEDFWEAGLRFVKANNNRPHGCANMREYMTTLGALYIDPSCVNTVRQIGLVLADPHDLEAYEKSEASEQHAVDMVRYLLNSRPIAGAGPGGPEPEQYTTEVAYGGDAQPFAGYQTDDTDTDMGYYPV